MDIKILGKCPYCGGHTTTGEGLACVLVYGSDGEIIWEGDIGEESCLGSWEGDWEDLDAYQDDSCDWRQRIGDAGYEDAKERARQMARCERED
jgi:hypothetical protein